VTKVKLFVDRIAELEERLARLESELGRHESRFDGIEERLARLEAVFLKEWKHNHLKEPSKPVTEEKPTEFDVTSIDAVVWAKEFMRCYKKFGYEVDKDTMRGWFASSIMAGFDEANRRNKKDDKPSEFISLPRGMAERYIRYVEAKDAPEAIEYYRSRQDVIDAIKQQLG
jgi:hypothetical protein